jgi:hypothetical protein
MIIIMTSMMMMMMVGTELHKPLDLINDRKTESRVFCGKSKQ